MRSLSSICSSSLLKTLNSASPMSITCREQEIQCVVHWFQGWSPLQKADFMKDLVEKAVPHKVSTLFGAMDALNMNHMPPSIFKCQLKLFGDWFMEWTDKERNEFVMRIEQLDADFVSRFNEEIASTSGQP